MKIIEQLNLGWKQLVRWIRLRPLVAAALALAVVAVGGAYGIEDRDSESWLPSVGYHIGMGLVLLVFSIFIIADRKKIVSIILCVAVGGSQVFGSSAGLFCWMNEGYCPPIEAASQQPIDGVTLQIIVDESSQARIVNVQHTPESAMVSAEEANAVLAGWGIQWTGNEAEQYATNGQPATAADVPFRISYESWPPRVVLYPDRPQFLIVVEAATRLGADADWSPILATSIPAGVLIHVEDLTRTGQGFYRVRHVTWQEFQAAAPIAIGIGLGLLIGGGYICYRVAKCAAKRARDRQTPPTNAPPPMAEMQLR